MKYAIVILALCLVLATPVMATRTDFQGWANASWIGTGTINGVDISPTTGVVNGYVINGQYFENVNPMTFDYAAWDHIGGGGFGVFSATLYDASHNSIQSFTDGNQNGRFEIKIVGMTPKLYLNGSLTATGSAIAVYPSYIRFSTSANTDAHIDNILVGETDQHVVGALPSNWTIIRDFITPTSTGVYALNPNTGAWVLKNSANFAIDADTSSFDTIYTNESFYIVDPHGTIINTTTITNTTPRNRVSYSLTQFFLESQKYGEFLARFGGSSVESPFRVIGNGASISYDKDSYSQQDTAIITYSITSTYWDTSTYDYSIGIISATTGTVVNSQSITTMAGTTTYKFTSSDQQGVYYAVVIATVRATSEDIWMNYDYAEVNAYVTFYGWVNDAQTAAVISSANVSIVQGSIISNTITDANGNYSATGFLTGATLIFNVTAAGHSQYSKSLIPLIGKSIPLNFTLNSTTPSYTGIGIGGVHRDGIFDGTSIIHGYGRPIPGASAYLKNTTNGDYCTNTSNNAGWYLFDEGNGCILTSGRLYDVWSTKTGYSNSPNYTVVAA